MTDDLVARVRSPFALTERDAQEIADALEARGKRIDELESRLVDKDVRISELEAELSACQRGNDSYHDQSILEHNRAVDMKLRIEELEAALKETLDYIDDPYNDLAIQIGELLDRAVLKGANG
jgi:predicted RNase H-like nuclease (RuvC/YqgF family)